METKTLKKELSEKEIKSVKGLGCLRDKRYDDIFNVRVVTGNGKISTEQFRAVAEASDKFGSGEVALTTRLTLEIQGVKYKDLQNLFDFLKVYGLETGGTGPKVRPIVSCKGTTCVFGLIDTYELSKKIHNRFYKGYHDTVLPHKFKIAVGGCPNNCVKPDINDLGIVGQRIPIVNMDKCKTCNICNVKKNCPMTAVKNDNGKISINTKECNNCGRCIKNCPFGALTYEGEAYKIFIGGRWGKKTAKGSPLNKIFTSQDEVLETVEKIINVFKANGIEGERFSDTIERLGMDFVESQIINGDSTK